MNQDYLNLVVEISVTVYVFLLGLPILVNQIFLPEDLRRISKKNYSGNISLHILSLTLILLLILIFTFAGSRFDSDNGQASRLIAAVHEHWISIETIVTALFVIMLVQTLGYLLVHMIRSQGYRAKIIDIIKNKVLRKYRKTGTIDEAFLNDLRYLGIYSKGGAETRNVIEALEDLLKNISKKHKFSSQSHSIINIIDILCDSVTNSVETGSHQNIEEVLTIYKGILMDLKKYSTRENELIYGNETRKLKDCTTKIAVTSLKKDYFDMMPLILNVLTLIPRSSDKLFDIGLMALDKEKYQIATNVLSEITDRDNQDYLTMNNYLGLVAHFFSAGNTARKCAERSLKTNKVKIVKKELKDAMEYHYIMSNFTTVDKLEQLMGIAFKN